MIVEKTVLCYGDSNTWGYVPLSGIRLPRMERWPGVLQELLGSSYYVTAEGLNGRSTAWDEPFREGRNGLKSIIPVLESHAPLNLVLLILGTNDLKHHLNVSPHESSRGLSAIVQAIQKSCSGPRGNPPKVLLVAPPKFEKLSELMNLHFEGGVEKSALLSKYYRQICSDLHCDFLDANEVVTVSEDGIHMESVGHRKLAEMLAPIVKKLLEELT
jgi:lysophospholipase L1-like esterase